nr:protein tumorous imaginal discs [Hymenolepis microstoma]
MTIKDTSMLVYKWVPVIEDEHTQPKKSGFARAQSNVLAPTGGSIITMSSHPPELRTEEKPLSESTISTTADNQPKSEQSLDESINDAEVKEESSDAISNDTPVDLTAMFARALRAETRSRARADSRRVHRTSEKVQKWYAQLIT